MVVQPTTQRDTPAYMDELDPEIVRKCVRLLVKAKVEDLLARVDENGRRLFSYDKIVQLWDGTVSKPTLYAYVRGQSLTVKPELETVFARHYYDGDERRMREDAVSRFLPQLDQPELLPPWQQVEQDSVFVEAPKEVQAYVRRHPCALPKERERAIEKAVQYVVEMRRMFRRGYPPFMPEGGEDITPEDLDDDEDLH